MFHFNSELLFLSFPELGLQRIFSHCWKITNENWGNSGQITNHLKWHSFSSFLQLWTSTCTVVCTLLKIRCAVTTQKMIWKGLVVGGELQWDLMTICKGRSSVDEALMMRKFFLLCWDCATLVHLSASYSCCGLEWTLTNEKYHDNSCTSVNNRSGLVVQPFERDHSAFLKLFVLVFCGDDLCESKQFCLLQQKTNWLQNCYDFIILYSFFPKSLRAAVLLLKNQNLIST